MRTLLLCFLALPILSFAQKKNANYQYAIQSTTETIKIDGLLDEKTWQTVSVAKDFFQVLPMDTSFAKQLTEVRIAYDDKNFYISAVNFQDHPIRVESLRRDWNFVKNDNFIFFLDPFDDQTNGFAFGVNAAGAEWDGQQSDGGSVNLNWDNRWESAVKQYDNKWIFEAAIPFKTLRYKKGITSWGVNFSRNDLTAREKSVWAPVPRQMPTAALAYTGVLQWEMPPPKTGQNISIIPFALGGVSRNIVQQEKAKSRADFGLDAKVALTSSMNLDMTINPDFSQVEVDRQQTNLDRFELLFPERRQFFLENSDLFNNLGTNSIRPFFSRRIGLNAPIYAGARMSGRLNKDWRLGVMDIGTGAANDNAAPAQNFSVITLQRRIQSRSNLTGFFINKESFTNESFKKRDHNRNGGLEYNLASKKDIWRGKFLLLKSFDLEKPNQSEAAAATMRYSNRKLSGELTQEYVGKNYNAEVGYVPRRGFHKTSLSGGYNFLPKSRRILSYTPSFMSFTLGKDFGNTIENEIAVVNSVTLQNRTVLVLWTAHNYIKLDKLFDPTNFTGINLPIGSEHKWYSWGTRFESKPQDLFTYGFESRYGGYFADGKRLRVAANAAYRVQPFGSLSIAAEYNAIKFPENTAFNLKNASFWLIGPRFDLTLTKKIYFTAFLQYNEQANNVNLNTRFQWRFAPASDLYFVYTDNYLPESFGVKNRAFVVKATYWWNL
jgi:hypothetical protein